MQPMLADAGAYLPIIIFIVLWLFSGRKQQSGKKPSAPQPDADAKQEIGLQDILRQILTGGEVSMEPPQSRPAPSPPAPPPPVRPAPAENEWRPPRSASHRQPLIPDDSRARRTRIEAAAVTPPPSGPAAPASTCLPGMGKRRRNDLRQAVIWAEILGPPVGLRD